MPWQENKDNMIDRFDVRAHLDIIPEYKPGSEPREVTEDDSQLYYERYRILVQNELSKSKLGCNIIFWIRKKRG
jgi:arginine/serine-rich splicing factor 16